MSATDTFAKRVLDVYDEAGSGEAIQRSTTVLPSGVIR
jgi:hypothetical protein